VKTKEEGGEKKKGLNKSKQKLLTKRLRDHSTIEDKLIITDKNKELMETLSYKILVRKKEMADSEEIGTLSKRKVSDHHTNTIIIPKMKHRQLVIILSEMLAEI
jgi:hypothetical protein